MLITVSGPAGSGKSTLAAAIADALGYEHVSGGDIFRSLADERGLSLSAFNELAEEDPSIDRDLDRRLRSIAETRDDLILESRLAGWMAAEHADLKCWLDAPIDVRVDRIAEREGSDVETAREDTVDRAESEAGRYEEYYGIDIEDRSIYDVTVNTARWGAADVLAVVETAVDRYDPATDEGATPITGVEYDFG